MTVEAATAQTLMLTVRYFAAARAAAGTETETVQTVVRNNGLRARRHPRRARSGARPGAAAVFLLM